MRTIRWLGLLAFVVLIGCAPARSTTQRANQGINTNTTQPVEHFIRIKFKTLECGCSLGQIEFALLSLPDVGRVRWAYQFNHADLMLIDQPGPTDAEIEKALASFDLTLKNIQRH